MKKFNFISMAIAALLVVFVAVGCTTLGSYQDDHYARTQGADRIYIDDPYRGTIVLERDPFSGRYYEINSHRIYNSRYYRGQRPGYYGRNYSRNQGNYNRNQGSINENRGKIIERKPTQEETRRTEQNKKDARNKVLGQ